MHSCMTYILAVAVVLAVVCLGLCYVIGIKDDRLARLYAEISEQKDTILELELELQRCSALGTLCSAKERGCSL